jgi:hypothetical protein
VLRVGLPQPVDTLPWDVTPADCSPPSVALGLLSFQVTSRGGMEHWATKPLTGMELSPIDSCIGVLWVQLHPDKCSCPTNR